ncbi:nuclease (plasmid) [Bradyrhizobium sp. CCGUVB1N3]|uniref:thermonuclease family protein n=1 Tax=Bradyrhizobium sp. CCGUVB1N3 TaxID=2949629 RepID=UPI0020B26F1F|nr:thermonuclease family protein [Bradyrhizobium sp. CCGUVB1N3]MCP3477901.1 nuclease [Bradyrhizobium sp. CCGUVB1N3]
MTRACKALGAGVVVVASIAPLAALAQGADVTSKVGHYSPRGAPQSAPMRVEVLDRARFRDIETGTIYRLYGVETCASGQIARLGRQPWPCGAIAVAWLVSATLNKWVACNTLHEENGERLARCASADHADLGADMIREGVAVTPPPTDGNPTIRAYVAAELEARKAYHGLWASSFEMPWEYRARVAARTSNVSCAEATP